MFNEAHSSQNSLTQDVRFLTGLLADIIRQQEGDVLLSKIEEIRTLAKEIRLTGNPLLVESQKKLIAGLSLSQAHKIARALTLYFQLVNIAEEVERIRRLREYDRNIDLKPSMSLRKLFRDLIDEGYSVKQITDFIDDCDITPVLTAHPTEAKRRTVLDHLSFISSQLVQLNRPDLTLSEKDYLNRRIKETMEILWQTSEIRSRKVDVLDEVDHTLFYFDRTIISLVANIHEAMNRELLSIAPDKHKEFKPFIRFGSWVGADRDGNPFVTPQVTLETAHRQRQLIVKHYLTAIEGFIHRFSQSTAYVEVSKELEQSLIADAKLCTELARELERFESSEIYRKKLSFMHHRLKEVLAKKPKAAYPDVEAFIDDLEILSRSLKSHKGQNAALGDLGRLIIQARTFRFSLAMLDFRDHSRKIRKATEDILGLDVNDAAHLIAYLTKSRLKSKKSTDSSAEAKDVNGQLEVFKILRNKYDRQMTDSYIVSMTETPLDILSVLALARHHELIHVVRGKVKSADIGVVPLFETINALSTCHEIMGALFELPFYRSYLKARGNVQEIMLGYSDSCKDGGYLAANWYLYLAQKKLHDMGQEYGIEIKFFHGKGGTIDRGGGQSHKAILGQPFSADNGRIKLTEQGEVVSQKYANPVIAKRNLEQLITATVWSNLVTQHTAAKDKRINQWRKTLNELSEISFSFYRSLVFETPGFLDFYHQATPIDVLKITKIGSRPSARSSQPDFNSLRAIPWVFSWVQSRYIISAWYGVGFAFNRFIEDHPIEGPDQLKEMYRHWPFFTAMIQNLQLSLSKTDLYISSLYADNVIDDTIRTRVQMLIEEEYNRCVEVIKLVTGKEELLQDQSVLAESIKLRNPYVDPLNYIQVRFLKEAKKINPDDIQKRAAIDEILLLTVNGIAAGMKSTG